MNNQCINFRKRTKTVNKKRTIYLYCTKNKKEITFEDCKGCLYKEYKKCTKTVKKSGLEWKKAQKSPVYCANLNKNSRKTAENSRKLQSSAKMKQKSSKLAKLERERFSLFTDNKDKCMFCNSTYQLTWHEIFRGRNRQNSMRYGLCLRMCLRCHELKQEDKQFNDEWKQKGQVVFQQTYPNLVFENIFRENYLK